MLSSTNDDDELNPKPPLGERETSRFEVARRIFTRPPPTLPLALPKTDMSHFFGCCGLLGELGKSENLT
jgi:hypothetical protein